MHLFTLNDTYTFGRISLDEGSARCRHLYLSTQHIHKRQTCKTPEVFKPLNLAIQWPPTHPLDHVTTGFGKLQ